MRFTRDRVHEADESKVGLGFIDVLFALVVGKILEPVKWGDLRQLSGPADTHLILAGIVTLSSWVGYHNSLNRPRYRIGFTNLPFAQFAVDIVLVVDYWLLATAAEVTDKVTTSARPEALLVTAAFVLYAIWDLIGVLIGRSQDYQKLSKKPERPWEWRPWRYACTLGGVALAAGVTAWSYQIRETPRNVVWLDVGLIVIVVLYRIGKDYKPVRRPAAHATGTRNLGGSTGT